MRYLLIFIPLLIAYALGAWHSGSYYPTDWDENTFTSATIWAVTGMFGVLLLLLDFPGVFND